MSNNKKITVLSLLIIAGCSLFYYFIKFKDIITTDNAYIHGDVTPIISKVSGYLSEVLVDDGQLILPNQILAKVEPSKFLIRLTKARAELDQAITTVAILNQQIETKKLDIEYNLATLSGIEAEYQKASSDKARAFELFEQTNISKNSLEKFNADYLKANANNKAAKTDLLLKKKALDITKLELDKALNYQQIKQQELELINLEYDESQIKSPIQGVIGNRSAKVGLYVREGSILMNVVPLDKLWIIANFKENQLTKLKIGNLVKIKVDAFSDLDFDGKVEAISPATGSKFSLLPAENASGNFTKIVQRVGVKISINNNSKVRLIPGMSVIVSVDTKL